MRHHSDKTKTLICGAMVLWMSVALLQSDSAQAQTEQKPPANSSPTTPQQPNDQSKLTEGLLDLLNEKDNSKSEGSQSRTIENLRAGQSAGSTQPTENPLTNIQGRMHRATLMLQQSRNLSSAVEVQASIVKQLDELIDQLEKQQASEQNNSTKQSQTQMQRQQQAQGAQGNQGEMSSKPARSKSSQPGDGSNEATNSDLTVRTRDPAALQQNVWGHLPARVRSQMQSRMVEEFLPSYRSKIEQYYRELMQEGEKK